MFLMCYVISVAHKEQTEEKEMKQFEVYRGCEIPTLGDYLKVVSTNGNIAYCDEYQINENGTKQSFVDEIGQTK